MKWLPRDQIAQKNDGIQRKRNHYLYCHNCSKFPIIWGYLLLPTHVIFR